MENDDRKQAYLDKLDAQLREWDAMWQVLKARVAQKRADVKRETVELLERVETTHGEARQKLLDLRRSAAENWTAFKARAEENLEFLAKAMAIVRSRLEGKASDDKQTPPSG